MAGFIPKFPPMVVRFRPILEKQASDLPTDFLLAWIEKESGGKTWAQSSLDERGLFQIHPLEVKEIGITEAQFDSLLVPTQNLTTAVQIGIKLVRNKIGRAKKLLAGTTWGQKDFWQLVKSQHGAPGAIKALFEKYKEKYGRVPPSWAAMKSVKDEFPKYLALVNKITANAEYTARFVPEGDSGGPVLAIVEGRWLPRLVEV